MYGVSVYGVPVHNQYTFSFYCEDKEALEAFGKVFQEFITKYNGTIELRNEDNSVIDGK